MQFHVVGLPDARTNATSSCAFNALTGNFIKMMVSLGHKVSHYGVGCNEICYEDVVVSTPVEMDWSGNSSYWLKYNQIIRSEINLRKQHGDFVCVINGKLNQLLDNISEVQVVEFAIGYTGTFSKYRVFASHSHMQRMWVAQNGIDPNGDFYNAVIPHYLDPSDFPLKTKTDNYFLYIGRLNQRKGIQIAIDTCKYLNIPLKIAGTGDYTPRMDGVEYLGAVNHSQRVKLYQDAIATFVPTIYLEPFGMTVIESQMCGTPVITTDWGSFPELIENGLNGFRCRTLNQFVQSAQKSFSLNSQNIRLHAIKNWSVDTIKYKYQDYFQSLLDLWDQGWNTVHIPDAA